MNHKQRHAARLLSQGVKPTDVARVVDIHKSTIFRWLREGALTTSDPDQDDEQTLEEGAFEARAKGSVSRLWFKVEARLHAVLDDPEAPPVHIKELVAALGSLNSMHATLAEVTPEEPDDDTTEAARLRLVASREAAQRLYMEN